MTPTMSSRNETGLAKITQKATSATTAAIPQRPKTQSGSLAPNLCWAWAR